MRPRRVGEGFIARVVDHGDCLPRRGIETVDDAGEGIGHQDRALCFTEHGDPVQEPALGEVGDFADFGQGGSEGEVEFEDGPGAGAVEGGVRGVAGGEVEDVGVQLGDAEEAEVGGEAVDEERRALLGGVDLVDVGGGEEGDEDFATGLDGEILGPGAGW